MSDKVEYEGTSYLQLAILFSAVFIDLVGFGIVIPILPFLNDKLGGTDLDYGLILAVYSLMQFIFSPIWGNLSDKYGRKPVIIAGLSGEAIGFALFAFASKLWMVYFARAFAGVFTAATLTTANAYIADTTAPEDRSTGFGLISAAFGLGFALGPGVGGLVAGFHALDPFLSRIVPIMGSHVVPSFTASALSVVAMVSAVLFLPESLKDTSGIDFSNRNRFPIMDTFNYTENDNTLLYVAIFALVAFGLSNFLTSFPLYAQVIDPSIDETSLGYYFTFIGILLFLTQSFFIRPLVKWFGEIALVRAGILFIIAGSFGVILMPTYILTFIPNFFYIIGIALLLPTMKGLLSNTVSDENQGNILGISQAWSAFSRIIGPILAGALFGIGSRLPFIFGALVFGVIGFVAFTKIDHLPQSEEESIKVHEKEEVQEISQEVMYPQNH